MKPENDGHQSRFASSFGNLLCKVLQLALGRSFALSALLLSLFERTGAAVVTGSNTNGTGARAPVWAAPKTGYAAFEFATPKKGYGAFFLIGLVRGPERQATARNVLAVAQPISPIWHLQLPSRKVVIGIGVPSERTPLCRNWTNDAKAQTFPDAVEMIVNKEHCNSGSWLILKRTSHKILETYACSHLKGNSGFNKFA